MALICVSLMTNGVEHLFHVLICHPHIFFGKNVFKCFGSFIIGLLDFLLLSFESTLRILYISPLPDL